jgi:hypothetical protein
MHLPGRALSVLVVLAASTASTQTVKETLEVTRQAAETQRRVLVSGALILADRRARQPAGG